MAVRFDSRPVCNCSGHSGNSRDHGGLHRPADPAAADTTVRLRQRSSGMIYFCSQKNRRALVLQSPSLNGIDYLEVLGNSPCGQELALTLLKDARQLKLTPANFTIIGGAPVEITSV